MPKSWKFLLCASPKGFSCSASRLLQEGSRNQRRGGGLLGSVPSFSLFQPIFGAAGAAQPAGGCSGHDPSTKFIFLSRFFLPLCSFKDCIPRSFYRQIQQNNYLTKFRMKTVFKKFVQRFQRHTVSAGKLTEQDIMYKYLATLEHLAPRFGSELYPVLSLETSSEGEKAPLYVNGGHAPAEHGHALLPKDPPVTHEVLVTGTSGIQWRPVPPEVG